MNLSSAAKAAKSIITANSPVLLVAASITGVVTTGVLAAVGGFKARGIIDDERMSRVASPEPPFDSFLEYKQTFDAKAPELTKAEMAKLTWLCYAVPAVTGASSIASVLGVHMIHNKRHAALASLYAVTSGKLDDYREKAEEMLGQKKTQQLNDAMGQKAIDRNPVENNEVIIVDGGTELCYDDWSGRYFMGSVPIIEKAFSDINLQLAQSGDASLNDFYDKIGIPGIPMGLDFGWSGGKISPRFGTAKTLSPDGRAAISFWFLQEPKAALGIKR